MGVFMSVFAHPDDESFAAGATLARLAHRGVTTVLVTATDGGAGRPGEPPVAAAGQVARVRARELAEAARILGIRHLYRLGYEDGHLDEVDPAAVAESIRLLILRHRPQAVLTFDAWGGNGHRDHRAVARALDIALRGLGPQERPQARYAPVIPEAMAPADAGVPSGVRVAVPMGPYRLLKWQALAAHATQHRSVEAAAAHLTPQVAEFFWREVLGPGADPLARVAT